MNTQRAMSKRAGATVVEVKGSHAIYVSQPRATGKDLGRVFHDHYHSYGLLIDSFEYKTAKVQKAS